MRESIFVYTTGPFPEILIGDRYQVGVVDDYSRYYWSFFMNTKSQLPNKKEELFEKVTSHGTPVKYLRCDNSDEHQSKFQKVGEKEKITLEYTTTHTPQFNGVIKSI